MKKPLVTLAVFVLLVTGCGSLMANLADEETRKLEPFSGIAVSISADVFYTTGNNYEIRIEGNGSDVKDLITEVEDGILKLRYENWKVSRSKLTIYITSRELNRVSVSGSAKFRSEKSVNSEEMSLSISGSGSVLFTSLNSKEMEVKISGSGDVFLEKGASEEMDVKISGSGKLNAEYFKVSELSAGISGSGSCRITVTDELEARISGSGSVYYHGDPEVDSRSSGSGKVKSL